MSAPQKPPTVADVIARSTFGKRSYETYQALGADLASWLAAPRPKRAEIDFDMEAIPSPVTARDIVQAWRVCPDDPACDMLARLALNAVEVGEAKDAVIRAAVALTVKQDRDKDELRSEVISGNNLPGPDITKDAGYRREVIAFLKRVGRCRPEWERL